MLSQVGDAAGNNPGFSRSCSSQKEQRTFFVRDGFTLLRVEAVEIEHYLIHILLSVVD